MVASIPHSGTFFTYYLLPGKHACLDIKSGHKYITHFSDPDHGSYMDKCLVVIPMRRFSSLENSWIRRGMSLEKLYEQWSVMLNYMWRANVYVFRIEEKREESLAGLSDFVGTNLETDWIPVNRYL